MSERRVGVAARRTVRGRAGRRGEYCRLPEAHNPNRSHVDHIVSRKRGRGSGIANFAYCCPACNLHKGTDIAGYDRTTRQVVRLFHPRADRWHDHFRLSAGLIVARTPVGRVTVRLLKPNAPHLLALRAALIDAGSF